LRVQSGTEIAADLYVDASGFRSQLMGMTLNEPFFSYKDSLFCDRAVVGGWDREDEPIKPYTTAETMNHGWAWQIEHERRINRGYVFSTAFVSDNDAEAEFRAKNPGPLRTALAEKCRCGRQCGGVRRAVGGDIAGVDLRSGPGSGGNARRLRLGAQPLDRVQLQPPIDARLRRSSRLLGPPLSLQPTFRHSPSEQEQKNWAAIQQAVRNKVANAYTVPEAQALIRSPHWRWPDNLYVRSQAERP
jgi:hypothetical protein